MNASHVDKMMSVRRRAEEEVGGLSQAEKMMNLRRRAREEVVNVSKADKQISYIHCLRGDNAVETWAISLL